jgi:hypothetical protein
MKKNYRFQLSLLYFFVFSGFAIAQTSLGSSKSFMNNLKKEVGTSSTSKTILKSNLKTVLLEVENSKIFNGTINYQDSNTSSEFLIGEIKNIPESSFYLKAMDKSLEGHIILQKTKEAYKYYSDANGNAFVSKVDINSLLCVGYSNVSESTTKSTYKTALSGQIDPALLILQSLPGAAGCVLLDFDGYNMPAGNLWNNGNPINAAPSGMSDVQIQQHWDIVAEDFRPFNLNITTSEAVFNSYPKNKRMRVVITPTSTGFPGVGGVAYVGSFNWDNDVPCWVYNLTKDAAKISSHEIAHTFDLVHDGHVSSEGYLTEYYGGLENTSWAPIMGIGSYRPVVQWSKGEYNYANNKQDEVAMISSSKFGVGYRADDYGNTTGSAANLDYNSSGTINQKNGIISSEDDSDFFTFTTSGGNVSINANTVDKGNLHLLIKLYNSAGVEMKKYFNPDPFFLNAAMNANLPAGKYFISIHGTGAGNPASGGYSAYGSIGSYSITGNIAGNVNINPSTDVVTVYKDSNFSGFSGGLTIGDYDTERLNSLGVLNDDISSLRISEGFQVILFQDDNFTGASLILNSDTTSLDNNWNNKVSSIRIIANGVTSLDNKTFFLQNRNSGLNLEMWNTSRLDGSDIAQGSVSKNDFQKFKFTHLGNGIYIITGATIANSFTVVDANKANGANVVLYPYAGTANQQFIVVAGDNGFYKFIARHSGKIIDVSGASMANGANLQQSENSNQISGQWKLISTIVTDNSTLIQAEDYTAMSGVKTEATTDIGGGLNVTDTHLGDWLAYDNIYFPTTGSYLIEYRVASAVDGAQIFTYLNDPAIFLGNVTVPNTGGGQKWQTVTQTVTVNAGTYNFGLYIQNKSMNINWIRISTIETEPSTLIQAEDYTAMSGIKTQTTTDFGGGLHVTETDAGDWLRYSNVNFPTSGSYLIEYRVEGDYEGAQIATDLNNGATFLGNINIRKWERWQTVSQTVNVTAGAYDLTIHFKNNKANINWIRITKITSQDSNLIQAENYAATGGGVKIEPTSDVGGGLNVKEVNDGDWLGYSNINFPTSGSYLIEYRVATAVDGAQIYADLNFGDFLNDVTVPNTGGWQNWQTVKQTINVNAGTYNLTIAFIKAKLNINWIRISKIEPDTTALIQAEDYSAMSGVETETTTDVSGGLNITDTEMGDFMNYKNVNFPVSGSYMIEYRVASVSGGRILTDLNNQKIILGSVTIPQTRGGQYWQTVTQTVHVDAGNHKLEIYVQSGDININWIRITKIGVVGTAAAMISENSTIIAKKEVNDSELLVYPNPVSEVLFFTKDVIGGKLSIVDSQTGSIVTTQEIKDNNINVSGLKKGVYLIVFEIDGVQTIKRFLKK